jgi:hypothetical protein
MMNSDIYRPIIDTNIKQKVAQARALWCTMKQKKY